MTHLPHGCNGYVDESIRGGSYLLTCAVVPAAKVDAVRRDLRRLLRPGQRRIHFSQDSEQGNQANLRAMVRLDLVHYLAYRTTWSRQRQARQRLVAELYRDAAGARLGELIFDERAGQDDDDLATVRRARRSLGGQAHDVRVDHLRSADEPLLWLPDGVGWALGRGGAIERLARGHVRLFEVAEDG